MGLEYGPELEGKKGREGIRKNERNPVNRVSNADQLVSLFRRFRL